MPQRRVSLTNPIPEKPGPHAHLLLARKQSGEVARLRPRCVKPYLEVFLRALPCVIPVRLEFSETECVVLKEMDLKSTHM